MKKSLFLCMTLLLACGNLSAQSEDKEHPALAVDSVWQEATRSGAVDLRVFGRRARNDEVFHAIRARFEAADSLLPFSDYMTLYYGYAYRDDYTGYDRLPDCMATNPKRALAKCLKVLARNPASPQFLWAAIVLADRLGRPEEEIANYKTRLQRILTIIYTLGHGTEAAPFIVTSVPDEYRLMYDLLGVEQVKNQQLILSGGEPRDRIEIEACDTPFFKGTEVWFDVSFSYPMLAEPQKWAKRLAAEEPHEKD